MIEPSQTSSPWVTRQWAAEYLREDTDTLDKRLTDSIDYVKNKIRFRRIQDGSKLKRVRVWKADVLKLLPGFEG